jgi:hypothetical protein
MILRMYHLDAHAHSVALETRLRPLLRHKSWHADNDGKWVRSLLTHIVSNFGVGFGHVAKEGTELRPVTWEMLEAACCAVEAELQQAANINIQN